VSLPKPSSGSAALITGASSGIGAEIARELARRGHDELADEVRKEHGVRAETLGCDLSKPASRDRLPGRVGSLGVDVEILVNNAGFATGGAFADADPARELEQVQVLVEAVVALTSAFLPAMVKRRRGAILNVASTAGMQPLPYSAGYSAAKAYVLTFSEAIYQEVRGQGVTVTALAPGPVDTEFWDQAGWQVPGGRSFEKAFPGATKPSAHDVAVAGVAGLDSDRRVVVPGLPMRAGMLAARYVPHAIKLPVIEKVMRQR
jgi:uncharacterized protein